MKELPLAELVPLWRTLRESGVTALVTPALDYVGALSLEPVDLRYAKEEQVASFGEAMRSLVGSLEDDSSLLFLYRLLDENLSDIDEYEGCCEGAEPAALREYVRARAAWLKGRPMRRVELHLFYSQKPFVKGSLARGQVGLKCMFANLSRLTRDEHESRLRDLGTLRDRLSARLAQVGLKARELEPADIGQVHYALLNPTRARERLKAGHPKPKDTLWSGETVRSYGRHLAEYSEAECLAFEDIEDARGHFRQGDTFRRVCTLKVLPEAGTHYFDAEPLLALSTSSKDGGRLPFGYWLSVAVNVQGQGRAKWTLSTQHGLVDALKEALPFLTNNNIAKRAADAAKQGSIQELFRELNEMSSKLVTLSVSLLLEAQTLEELDRRTESARGAFNAIGNSELFVEEVSQVPAFVSMFPGAGAYQVRKKACTSRNAADFLPLFAPWRGTTRASSILETPGGEAFKFDLFDRSLSNSHHGIVVGQTGAGKSVSLGALTLDALAADVDAILIDNGESWRPFTELLGGVYLPVDIHTSMSPFVSYEEMLDEPKSGGKLDNENIEDVVNFLQVCVAEPGSRGFDKVAIDVVSRAVRATYEKRFRSKPQERPLISAFRDELVEHPWRHADDKAIAENVARRLAIFCDGLYGDFLNRPSSLRFDARILTFDLQRVAKSPTTQGVAMATVMQAVMNRALTRKRRLLIEVDEGHEQMGDESVSGPFWAGCSRKLRKYNGWLWMISQHFTDYLRSKVGKDIVENATLKIFLRRDAGHEAVIDYFGLSPRAAEAFKRLEFKAGHYSDFFLMYGGTRMSTVRLRLHPLAYWILTTDSEDRRLLERAQAKNPGFPRFELLKGMAEAYPHGAPKQLQTRAVGQSARPETRASQERGPACASRSSSPKSPPKGEAA